MIGIKIIHIIEFILEVALLIGFIRAFFKKDEFNIKRFGFAIIIVLLSRITSNMIL